MFHLGVMTASQAVVATPTALVAIQDGWLTVANSQYTLPQAMRILASFAQGANIGQARINTPSLRTIALPSIVPVQLSATVVSLFPITGPMSRGPLIPQNDQIIIETTNGGGGGEQQTGALWLGDGLKNVPSGDIITCRATSSTTVGNLVWGQGTFTFDTGLPYGRYAIVGLDVFGANLLFARLVFPNQGPKPGVLARATQSILPAPTFRNGNFGVFGEFWSTAPPSIELFGSAAPVTQTMFIDLVKTG